MPACTACTMLRNLGFSSGLLFTIPISLVNVEANQSRTSSGTESDWMSESSSSVSKSFLQKTIQGNQQDLRHNIRSTHRWTAKKLDLREAEVDCRINSAHHKMSSLADGLTPRGRCAQQIPSLSPTAHVQQVKDNKMQFIQLKTRKGFSTKLSE